jgi:hypothetical protein
MILVGSNNTWMVTLWILHVPWNHLISGKPTFQVTNFCDSYELGFKSQLFPAYPNYRIPRFLRFPDIANTVWPWNSSFGIF